MRLVGRKYLHRSVLDNILYGRPEATWVNERLLENGAREMGMDVVEVAPSYDHAEITSLAGARL